MLTLSCFWPCSFACSKVEKKVWIPKKSDTHAVPVKVVVGTKSVVRKEDP